MVTRLLNLSGLHLGPTRDLYLTATDNPDGYWENARFVRLNDELLRRFGGAWDVPPSLPTGWESQPELQALRDQAGMLLRRLGKKSPWGWKDPRNSLTLPFWRSMIPDLKVVICVRNPVEVAASLRKRAYSSTLFSFKLWAAYNRSVFEAASVGERIITHFDAFFPEPKSELLRILQFLEIPASDRHVREACASVRRSRRDNSGPDKHTTASHLSAEFRDLYRILCEEAGPIYTRRSRSRNELEDRNIRSPVRLRIHRALREFRARLLHRS